MRTPRRAQSGPLADFARKCKAAFRIFFPPRPKTLTPKEEGRNRLRMILVADRCAMNANSLVEMKTSIVNAVANYVEVCQGPAVSSGQHNARQVLRHALCFRQRSLHCTAEPLAVHLVPSIDTNSS